MTSAFLLLTAFALFRRLRIGAVAGAAWALVVLALLAVALTHVSVSYSFAARLFIFGPAAAFNIGLLVALWRRLNPVFATETN